MKKAALILALMFAFMKPVHAQVMFPGVPGSFVFTGAAPVTATFIGGMTAFALLPVAIVELQSYKVWEQTFPSVAYEYPHDHKVVAEKVNFVSHTPYHVVSRFGTDSIRSD